MSDFITNTPARRYFKEISDIPRGSGNETGIANYLVEFAKKNGLEYEVHPTNNVVIKKPATPGYEDHDAVMMQAHIDIVCEKEQGCTHNFETDPLDLYVDENNFLRARGTTLGADDGQGVAYMLALLTEENAKHPALECVFTRSEEVGLIGAKEVDCTNLKAKKMINLDGGGEVRTTVSSSGGCRMVVSKEIVMKDNNMPVYTMEISECLGGHSGGTIHLERSNAIKLVFRVLRNLSRSGATLRFVSAFGGAKENAIARACKVTFASDYANIIEESNKYFDEIRNEVIMNEPEIKFSIVMAEDAAKAACPHCTKAVVEMIDLMPYGLLHKDLKLNIPILSLNQGIFSFEDGKCSLMLSIRSPFESYKMQVVNTISDLAELFEAKAEMFNSYGGWTYDPDSKLREILREVLRRHDKELIENSTHGGLETGLFKAKMPDLDIITFGPMAYDCHTPQERLDLDSFDRTYGYFLELVEAC